MRASSPKGESCPLEVVLEQGEQGGTKCELTTEASPRKAKIGWKALIGALGGFAILAFAALAFQQQPQISQTVSRRSDFDFDALPVCAQEGGDCTCGEQSDITVAYGANGKYNVLDFTSSSVACTNEVFGDPIYGVVKTCRCISVFDAWPVCAQEGDVCTCGEHPNITLAYGANGKYNVYNFVGSSVACNNEVLGDPIGGVVKACRCIATPSAFIREENLVLHQTWVHCAYEGETCNCPRLTKRRFGGDGVFVEDGRSNRADPKECTAKQFVGAANFWGPDVAKTCQCLVESTEEVQRSLTPQEYAQWQTLYSETGLDCADATPDPSGVPESCTCQAGHCSYAGNCAVVGAAPICSCWRGHFGLQCQDIFI